MPAHRRDSMDSLCDEASFHFRWERRVEDFDCGGGGEGLWGWGVGGLGGRRETVQKAADDGTGEGSGVHGGDVGGVGGG